MKKYGGGHKIQKWFKYLRFVFLFSFIGLGIILFLFSIIVAFDLDDTLIANWTVRNTENKSFDSLPTKFPSNEIKITAEQIIEKINEKRTEAGLSTLTYNSLLTQAANTKADDMMKKDYYSYDAPDGTTAWEPILNAGYNYIYASAQFAYGYTFVNEVINGWFEDKKIKDDILDKYKYKEIGVSVKYGYFQGKDTNLVVVYMASTGSTTTGYTTSQKITCTGPDGKTFQATQQECNDFNTKWGNAPKPTSTKSLPVQSKPSYPNYVTITCVTVYGTYTSYGKDYTEANNYCSSLQQYALNLQKNVPTVAPYVPNSYQPVPTVPPYPTEDCNAIKNEWQQFKESFMANNYNSFSSSAEAIYALESYRNQYQTVYSNTGCSGTLSLY